MYVNLHNHSAYSLLDSISRIDEMVARVKELGQTALAVTDHGSLHSMVQHYKACKKAGIKPILGIEAYMTQDASIKTPENSKYFHLLLLARTNEGLRNLMELSSRAYLEGFYYRPRMDYRMLSDLGKGIIGTSACMSSEISRVLMEDEDEAAKIALQYAKWFDEFFLEMQAATFPEQIELNHRLVRLAKKTGLPLLVSTDSHYVLAEDAYVHDLALQIRTGGDGEDSDRLRFSSNDFYLKSEEEVRETLLQQGIDPAAIDEAISNTAYVAKACEAELELGKWKMPKAPVAEGMTAMQSLRAKALGGLLLHLQQHPELDFAQYKKRLDYELQVMEEAGIADYMLLVADICRWAAAEGIPMGPGRGSVGGSLVAMCIGIHEVDPIKFGLDFERFYVPGRTNLPDIDLDFDPRRRQEVINYIVQKYGEDSVAAIRTFQTLGAKAAIRDVFRVLPVKPPGEEEPRILDYAEVDKIAKSVPEVITDEDTQERLRITIDLAIEESPQLAEYAKMYPEAFNIARKLEGLPRHLSKHAGGVVVTPGHLMDYIPIMRSDEEGIPVTQLDKDDAEDMGILKIDILGVDEVGVISQALRWVKDDINLSTLPLDDEAVYKDLRELHTFGIFQLGTPSGTRITQQVRPETFQHLVDVVALNRPGPQKSGQVSSYIRRKDGLEHIDYPHDATIPVLERTYGLMVYQEQIMAITRILAGFDFEMADQVRKACARKDYKLMDELQEKFIKGCEEKGLIDSIRANEIWAQIRQFGDYAFNLSHSVAYALTSYRTAWLKHYYPAEFMAATMTVEAMGNNKDKAQKITQATRECRRLGVELFLPDVNLSDVGFLPENGGVRWGLAGIRGVGEKAAQAIIANRPYESLLDFLERVPKKFVNKRAVSALIAAGAFDAIEKVEDPLADRIDLLKAYYAWRKEELPDVVKLDSRTPLPIPKRKGPRILGTWEQMLYGTYILEQPFGAASTWTEAEDGEEVEIVGQVLDYYKRVVQRGKNKGKEMAFIRLDTAAGPVRAVAWPEQWQRIQKHIQRNAVLRLVGVKEDDKNFQVDKASPLETSA